MGIPNLTLDLQSCGGRIRLYEGKEEFVENEIATKIASLGMINCIGIDGAVFLHDYTNGHMSLSDNASNITNVILKHIKQICEFFSHYNQCVEQKSNCPRRGIFIFFCLDGKPPVEKNRRKSSSVKRDDDYMNLSMKDKHTLQQLLVENLERELANEKYCFEFQSNISQKNREEGEIALMKFVTRQERAGANIVLSSDSDITAMVILRKLSSVVIVTPNNNKHDSYISNLQSISDGLNLNYDQLFDYVILHILFFGSDYNYGLFNYPKKSDQVIFHEEISQWDRNPDINAVGRRCIRIKVINHIGFHESDIDYLKDLLFLEGFCSILYYISLGELKCLLTDNVSPLVYLNYEKIFDTKVDIRVLVALLKF